MVTTKFKRLRLPSGGEAIIPADITIHIPHESSVTTEETQRLAYIPWDDKYLEYVPEMYQDFFYRFALPLLHVRTSDVHTTLSISHLPELLDLTPQPVDERVVYLALILHDIGWSKVSPRGIANSLSYTGVSPNSAKSSKPKQQHLVYGEALAYKLLDAYDFGPFGPDDKDKYYISEIIRRHDNDAPWEEGKYGTISIEMELVCDGDRLWSFTHENFWLDTIRKGIAPEEYIENITEGARTYFFTDAGRTIARRLLEERRAEVDAYKLAKQESSTLKLQHPISPLRKVAQRYKRDKHYLKLLIKTRQAEHPGHRAIF